MFKYLKELKTDVEVQNTVSGMHINIISHLPIIGNFQYHFNDKKGTFIDIKTRNIPRKDIIKYSAREPDKFISPIFLREKSDERYCLILNFKKC